MALLDISGVPLEAVVLVVVLRFGILQQFVEVLQLFHVPLLGLLVDFTMSFLFFVVSALLVL